MDELIKKVAEKAGIGEDAAAKAIQVVMEQLNGKLPGPIAAQVQSALGGGGGDGDLADSAGDALKKGLGGFGR